MFPLLLALGACTCQREAAEPAAPVAPPAAVAVAVVAMKRRRERREGRLMVRMRCWSEGFGVAVSFQGAAAVNALRKKQTRPASLDAGRAVVLIFRAAQWLNMNSFAFMSAQKMSV